jgi:hypothetical protein
VTATRVTVIDTSTDGSPWESTWALPVLARFLAAHRVAAADPFAPDADPSRASDIRVGHGTGDQLALGNWTEVRTIDVPEPPKPGRRSKHRPADRLAAILSGRDAVLACEELTLRARADFDHGRDHEAALQLEAALLAAIAELAGWVTLGDLAARVNELTDYTPAVSSAASAARAGTLSSADLEAISAALTRLEAALRARALYAAHNP